MWGRGAPERQRQKPKLTSGLRHPHRALQPPLVSEKLTRPVTRIRLVRSIVRTGVHTLPNLQEGGEATQAQWGLEDKPKVVTATRG